MKTILTLLALMFVGGSWEDAALYVAGASAMEELSQSEMEHFAALNAHPLPLNTASRGKLLSSGLLTPYQVAVIADYRARHGDILSFSELALIDGIPEELADALRHFVSLESRGEPGKRKSNPVLSGSISGRISARSSSKASCDVKSVFDLGDMFSLCAGNKSFSATYFGKRHIGKIIIGDFNAKFGQGLVQWSGFSLSGFNTIGAFCRNGTGISPCCSFSSDHNRGVAANLLFGCWSVDFLSTVKGTFGVNAGWTGKSCDIGVNCVADIVGTCNAGVNAKFTVGSCTFFTEMAARYDNREQIRLKPAAVAGIMLNLGYLHRLSAVSKYDGKWTNAIGYQREWLFASIEFDKSDKKDELKLFATANRKFSLGAAEVEPSLRWQEKLSLTRSSFDLRSELRADVKLQWHKWGLRTRFDVVNCSDWAFLTYLEGGYEGRSVELQLRPCVFYVKNWSDRIYCYEKDVPGSFNVTAFNGKGLRVSAYSAFKMPSSLLKRRLGHKFHLRMCGTWIEGKSVSFEVRISYNLSF